jgi:hypothetical protein
MAWWFQPLEILKDGNPSGRYRMTRWSDEDGGGRSRCARALMATRARRKPTPAGSARRSPRS